MKRGFEKYLRFFILLVVLGLFAYLVIAAISSFEEVISLSNPANNAISTNGSLQFNCSTSFNTSANFTVGGLSVIGVQNLSLFITNTSNLPLPGASGQTWIANQTNITTVANNTNVSFSVNFNSAGSQDGNWSWNCYVTYTNSSLGVYNFSAANRTFIVSTGKPTVTLNLSDNTAFASWPNSASNTRNISLNCSAYTGLGYGFYNLTLWINGTGANYATWAGNLSNTSAVTNGSADNTFDLNNTPDGNYTWNCLAQDRSPGNNTAFASANRTFIVDVTPPKILTINSPVNDTNQSSSTLNVNWSFADNVYTYSTCSINLNNGGANDLTGIIAQNGSTGISTNRTITGLADGIYRYNVTCVDGASNQNISNTFKVTIEGAGATLTLSPSTNTNLNLGQSKDVSCSASTISQVTSMTLETVGEKTICSNQNTASCSGTYVAGGSGDKTLKCSATTAAGVTVTKSITLSVLTDSGAGTGTGGGGGSGSGTTAGTTTTTASGGTADVSTTATTTSLSANENVNVVVDGTQSTLTVTSVGVSSATAQIAGETVTLYIGQSQSVDLNDDGTDDIKLSLTSIKDGEANFEIKKSEARVTTEVGPSEPVAPVSAEEKQVAKSKTSLWMLLGLIVIIVIVGVVFYFIQRGKVGKNKKYRP